jgi:hypothetical protein
VGVDDRPTICCSLPALTGERELAAKANQLGSSTSFHLPKIHRTYASEDMFNLRERKWAGVSFQTCLQVTLINALEIYESSTNG